MNPDPRRPTSHVTVETGWLNDAYGITWRPEATEYVMYFQHFPDAPAFDPRMSWAGTRSPDLVHWSRPEVVLRPGPGHAGIWSGTAVDTPDGLRLLYTGVGDLDGTAWSLGQVVLVDPAVPDVREVVIAAPPDGVGVSQFRDPYVWPAPGGGWRMLLGAAIGPDEGAVFAYSGPDLRTWTYDGVACRRRMGTREAKGLGAADDGPPEWTGSMWECPQLIEVDGAWVLILSVGADAPAHVVYAVGDLDWPSFTPGVWRRLWYGESAYATTAFPDRDGRPCVLTWCRESVPDPASPWSGALSYPHLLRRTGDRLHIQPHPDVDGLRLPAMPDGTPFDLPADAVDVGPVGAHVDLGVRAVLGADGVLRLTIRQDAGDLLTVELDAGADRVALGGRGITPVAIPLGRAPDGTVQLRLLLDASVAEVVTASGTALLRCAPTGHPLRLTVAGDPPGLLVQSLTVHGLSASVGDAPPRPPS